MWNYKTNGISVGLAFSAQLIRAPNTATTLRATRVGKGRTYAKHAYDAAPKLSIS